jgi:tetratricopeptide (TPR) repeat protein
LAYQLRPDSLTEPGCNQQTEYPYLVCLGIQRLESNLEGVAQQPLNFRAMVAAGKAAFNLSAHESAIDSYTRAVDMVPNAWGIRNDLAESLINNGNYDDALAQLARSMEITETSKHSGRAFYLKGTALHKLGQLDNALATLKAGISQDAGQGAGQLSLDLIGAINMEKGVDLDIEYFDALIERNPEDAVAYYHRGLAQLTIGNHQEANLDMDKARALGLRLQGVIASRGYARLMVGNTQCPQPCPENHFEDPAHP